MTLRSSSLQSIAMGIVCAATVAACGGGGGGTTTAAVTPTTYSAVLTDGPVKGVCYLASPSGLHGTTSATGAYNFNAGDFVAFWIDTSGAGCGTTAANSASTTGIALGAVTPDATVTGTTQQTFVLSLTTGSQAAETLQALNHGTVSNMDVSGISLPPSSVQDINTYVSTTGLSTGTAASVVGLFTAAQSSATVASAPLAPTLPVLSSFQNTVVSNLATTVTSGLGAAPTNFTIPAGTLAFAINNGTITATTFPTDVLGPYAKARILYYGSNGSGKRVVSDRKTNFSLTATTGVDNLNVVVQPFTYTVSGNTVNLSITKSNYLGVPAVNIASSSTMTYFDGKSGFYSGSASSSGISTGFTESETFTGANVRLTALTNSMLAGKVLKLAAPNCANGVATWTFSSDGITATSDCGSTRTFTPSTDLPGVMVVTSPVGSVSGNDGAVLFMGLDGFTVGAGSALAFVTENPGTIGGSGFPGWGRLSIIAAN